MERRWCLNCDGIPTWKASCDVCGDEFEADRLDNPYPKGVGCPTCRKRKLEPLGRLHFATDAPTFVTVVDETEDLEAPIDEPT